MTEFEQATLAHQTATLAAQQAALWVAIVVAIATCISAIAATVAAGGIWYGIRAMIRANKDRAGILDQQRKADERRHEENMVALKALIGGLERQTASLEAVVERTAPNRGAAE